jgi:hypothetical protein
MEQMPPVSTEKETCVPDVDLAENVVVVPATPVFPVWDMLLSVTVCGAAFTVSPPAREPFAEL